MRRLSTYAIIFIILFLSGCGKQREPENYFDIVTEKDKMSDLAEGVDTSGMLRYKCLGTQYYHGEKVQLWGEGIWKEGGAVYLHREDGSRELLMEKVHNYFLDMDWWLDEEGRCYVLNHREMFRPDMEEALWTDNNFKTREGVVFLNEIEIEEGKSFWDICQLKDGRIIVLISNGGANIELKELDPDSGRLDKIQSISASAPVRLIAAESQKLLLLGDNGIWECSLADGSLSSIIAFEGTSYTLKSDNFSENQEKADFRLLEDGRVELLWSDGSIEYFSMQEVNKEKEIIKLRMGEAFSWMKEQVVKFNQQNENYYITIEEPEDDDINRFLERTDMELGAGRGADIICSNAVSDMYSLLEKGAFADLAPYMEASGIREEDYFPAAFAGWKYDGRIYGVNYSSQIEGLCIDKAIAGEEGISSVEELVDRLLEFEEDAVFQKDLRAVWVLECFLKDSESLCGMVDFKNGTCDFSGELFEKMLVVAERYGDGAGKKGWKYITDIRPFYTFYCFNHNSQVEKEGWIAMGYLFDGGPHVEFSNTMMAINVNSDEKEGAWEFISFLLGEEVQSAFSVDEYTAGFGHEFHMGNFPVSRSVFEKLCGEHVSLEYPTTRTDTYYNRVTLVTGLTEERKEDLRAALEDARPAPIRTKPLLDIILEEADAYFSGIKTIDEVRNLIENRVQLFLNERN